MFMIMCMDRMNRSIAEMVQEFRTSPILQFDGIVTRNVDVWSIRVEDELRRSNVPPHQWLMIALAAISSHARDRIWNEVYTQDLAGYQKLVADLRREYTPERIRWYDEVRRFTWERLPGEGELGFIARFERVHVLSNPNQPINHEFHTRRFLQSLPIDLVHEIGQPPAVPNVLEMIGRARWILMGRHEEVHEAADEPGPNVFREMANAPFEEDPEEFSELSDISYQEI